MWINHQIWINHQTWINHKMWINNQIWINHLQGINLPWWIKLLKWINKLIINHLDLIKVQFKIRINLMIKYRTTCNLQDLINNSNNQINLILLIHRWIKKQTNLQFLKWKIKCNLNHLQTVWLSPLHKNKWIKMLLTHPKNRFNNKLMVKL